MTTVDKEKLINEILSILQAKIKIDVIEAVHQSTSSQNVEMLTLKECTEVIKGISEHTLRLLIKQDKIPCFRTGEGNNDKILRTHPQ